VDGLGATRLDKQVELGIYRVVQAGLENAVEHAEATEIVAEVASDRGAIVATVRDNGHGFDTAAVLTALDFGTKAGDGLRTIHEWTQALGGEIELTSGPSGTLIRARIPLAAA
jgi:signal transduction histidine kinase